MRYRQPLRQAGASLVLAARAMQTWGVREYSVAAFTSAAFAVLVGIATVLIPNPLFARDVATLWWNYPVWILMAIGTGLLTATYLRPRTSKAQVSQVGDQNSSSDRRGARMGMAGGLLAWFAVGCPVCNKIALLALGYSGAITWFAPVQPWLAVIALVLTGTAVVWRLKGQIACPVPRASRITEKADMSTP